MDFVDTLQLEHLSQLLGKLCPSSQPDCCHTACPRHAETEPADLSCGCSRWNAGRFGCGRHLGSGVFKVVSVFGLRVGGSKVGGGGFFWDIGLEARETESP